MSKSAITRTFIGSLVALGGGLFLLIGAGGLAYANDDFIMNGPDVVGIRSTWGAWALTMLAVTGLLAMFGALIAQFVAWIGAVINTAQLPNKTLFVIVLACGLISFGFLATVIYLIAAPKDTQPHLALPIPAQSTVGRSTPVG